MKLLLLTGIFIYNANLICGPTVSKPSVPDWIDTPAYAPPLKFEMPYNLIDNPTLLRSELKAAIVQKFAEENEAARVAITRTDEPWYRPRVSVMLQYNEPLKFWQKAPKQRQLDLDWSENKPVGKVHVAGLCQAYLTVMQYKVVDTAKVDVSKMC